MSRSTLDPTPVPGGLLPPDGPARRVRLEVHGAVQGVGFRPFVYRLARQLGVGGWVANDPAGARIEAEADEATLWRFLDRLRSDAPPRAVIQDIWQEWVEPQGDVVFLIQESDNRGARVGLVQPDLATCPDCVAEIQRAGDRRRGYPFTNCTHCGPRFSIIQALPYDRARTTMAGFTMCPVCAIEYSDPADRRFHAQPNACPECGPHLTLRDATGQPIIPTAGFPPGDAGIIAAVAAALAAGAVVAVKGLGGFHLMCDARSEAAVQLLRARKEQPTKPLAVMVRSLEQAGAICVVDEAMERLLASRQAPIVLAPRRPDAVLTDAVAPGNPYVGIMLAHTPLHHLLLQATGFPVVATSGNRGEEPICIAEAEAVERLGGIADLFLVHDRPIERHVDDSVAWIVSGEPRLLRRARGFAPLPVVLPEPVPSIVAVGGEQKSAIALSSGRNVFLSQHIGDLESAEAQATFDRVVRDFLRLYEAVPVAVAHDLHPEYVSTRRAAELANEWTAIAGRPVSSVPVQHHHAHLVSCMVDNGVTEPALGVTWDGTGLGTDGTIWGGEFLLGDARDFRRVAHLLPFRLPGGEATIREPRRVAVSLLYALLGEEALRRDDLPAVASFSAEERDALGRMLGVGINAPLTTSAGRLFDGVSALLGLRLRSTFEGEAAIDLEFAADTGDRGGYALPWASGGNGTENGSGAAPALLDWRPLVAALLDDMRRGVPVPAMAARFHGALVDAITVQAVRVGCERVALTGGCFQNRLLTDWTRRALRRRGFQVLLHRQVPPNDGGLSLGQAVVAAARLGADIEPDPTAAIVAAGS